MKMIKVILWLVCSLSFIYANPILVTYINEIQTGSNDGQLIELHPSHNFGPSDIGGWTIRTQAGVATINTGITVPYNGFTVIDTDLVSGVFYLNPVADSLRLHDNYGYLRERIVWGFPGSKAPVPPFNGSLCIHRSNPSMYWDFFSYYIDSTPTIELQNDDYSSMSGTVFNNQGQPVNSYCVIADGHCGSSCDITNSSGQFNIIGLAQCKYWVTVWSSYNTMAGSYSDSIYLGYSQNIQNLNIYLPISGIEQTYQLTFDNIFPVFNPFRSGSKISFTLPYNNKVIISLFDIKGSLVKTLLNQQLNAGYHELNVNTRYRPGVYFLAINIGNQNLTRKLIVLF